MCHIPLKKSITVLILICLLLTFPGYASPLQETETAPSTEIPESEQITDDAVEPYDLRMDYLQDLIQQDAYSARMDVYEELSSTVTPENFWEKFSKVPEVDQMGLCALGMQTYGVDFRWMGMLIGTTAREGYFQDPYLYYAWACAMLNDYRWYPADAVYWLMSGWGGTSCELCGPYYSEHAVVYGCGYHASFCNVSQEVLKCIYLALTDRDERIFEVDGMVTGGNYSKLIYSSPVYNCQVWSW